jgi:tetratricopeptide (TPR) repeat protein
MIELLSEMPRNLAFVLISPDNLEGGPNIAVSGYDSQRKPAEVSNASKTLDDFMGLVDTEYSREAAKLWSQLKEGNHTEWSEQDWIRYYLGGYWVLIRIGKKEDAEYCISKIKEIEEGDDNKSIEGLLLRGNFVHRDVLYNEAREIYAQAWELAQRTGNRRDQGRARAELAYIAFEIRDYQLSEQYYRDSVDLLEQVDEPLRDSLWSSALGRALRDYAQLLAGDAGRAQECRAYLRRALAIHSIDGRRNQVAACLQTRGKLERTLGNWEQAESAFQASASILFENGNQAGWVFSVREMAEVSYRRKQYDQCLAILKKAFERLAQDSESHKVDKGRIALQAARVHWSLGEIDKANHWCDKALELLPEGRRQERNEAAKLRAFIRTLIDPALTVDGS